MSGHASEDQLRELERLEAQIDPLRGRIEDVILLGKHYLCPMHDDERAMRVFEIATEREPDHPWALYWLTYIYLWEEMDRDSLLRARDLLASWLDSETSENWGREARAALLQRYVEVRDSPDLGNLSDLERIALLEEAVRLAPAWTLDRWYLARAYARVGREADAEEHLKIALANMAEPKDRKSADDLFETDVTGRLSEYLKDEIPRMLDELRDKQR